MTALQLFSSSKLGNLRQTIPSTSDLLIRTGSMWEGGGRFGITNMIRSTATVEGGIVPSTRWRLLIEGWRRRGEGACCLLRTMVDWIV
ncbi:BQ2448_4257 [Microbotryum intermedium]|uniref:BQ2448_4257 protein n=1 Tax=Microbotryum intermedium TaxID=269621 RepID=A0A238FFY0_9BASI|nr:BQ2448_4257 [Microbotryum intermedium]